MVLLFVDESHYSVMFRLSLLRPAIRPLLTATRFTIPSVRFSSGRRNEVVLKDNREARSVFEVERNAGAPSVSAKYLWSHYLMDREDSAEEIEQGDS